MDETTSDLFVQIIKKNYMFANYCCYYCNSNKNKKTSIYLYITLLVSHNERKYKTRNVNLCGRIRDLFSLFCMYHERRIELIRYTNNNKSQEERTVVCVCCIKYHVLINSRSSLLPPCPLHTTVHSTTLIIFDFFF